MPSWAWVVTYNGRNAGAAYSFQCPLGLELLLPDNCRKSSSLYSFNALSGLSCYLQLMWSTIQQACFNALSGLSCYSITPIWSSFFSYVSMPSRAWVVTLVRSFLQHNIMSFQCPLGLELLRRSDSANFHEQTFQCPLGLELLRQECPIF